MRLLSALLLCSLLLLAEHVQWRADFRTAHQEALKTDKTLMVLLLHSKDDAKTQKLLSTLFMDQPYIKQINNSFVAVLLSKDQTNTYPIEMLYTLTYPALFFLDAQELFTCKPLRGDWSAAQLAQQLSACR